MESEGVKDAVKEETPKRQNPFDKEDIKGGGEDQVDSGGTGASSAAAARHVADEDDSSKPCAIYFGVKSYLHHFYEVVSVKNPNLYEEFSQGEDFHYLIRPRRRKCSSVWFKAGLVVGASLLVWGMVSMAVGYAVPRQQVVVGYAQELEVIDRAALEFNGQLELCKMAGLVLFCLGGLVTVLTLLFPTFLSGYCDESLTVEPFRVSVKEAVGAHRKIPVTEQIKSVQPTWEKAGLATNKGLITFP